MSPPRPGWRLSVARRGVLGQIDVVCANAGTGGPAGLIETLDYRAWQDCVAVNLNGAFLTCRWARG
jgi:NAD(P)-dependent dehydrogenase (short-subunit alcohol dehydrogenase family)